MEAQSRCGEVKNPGVALGGGTIEALSVVGRGQKQCSG